MWLAIGAAAAIIAIAGMAIYAIRDSAEDAGEAKGEVKNAREKQKAARRRMREQRRGPVPLDKLSDAWRKRRRGL